MNKAGLSILSQNIQKLKCNNNNVLHIYICTKVPNPLFDWRRQNKTYAKCTRSFYPSKKVIQ